MTERTGKILKTIHAKIQSSCFEKVYWFSRYLLNTDQFGALGKNKETEFLNLVAILETLLTQENFSAEEKIKLFKKTLRERWKQLSQADRGTLSHFKIRELWHLITFDKDLSDDKIVLLGEQGQIFYLPEFSETYKKCSEHPGMKNYVRPLKNFVGDIKKHSK